MMIGGRNVPRFVNEMTMPARPVAALIIAPATWGRPMADQVVIMAR